MRHRTYSYIYNVQRMILLIFYTTTAIALSVPLAMLMHALSPNQLFPLFFALVLYLVAVVLLGSLISVISYIPFNLATSFDPIKNEIASGEISTIEQLGKRITSFTVDFFDFSFLDITHAFLQTGTSPLISRDVMPELDKVLQEYQMLEKSRQLEDVIRAGEIELPGGRYHLYILPIWFGDHWLGYMAMLSERRISRFFLRFLSEYENNFLDDQIMHIVHYAKSD